ncbi:fibroleukin-like [Asterias rubens]|uniref:fibroleukin-like n=1 Tax=Asterias rubens TaxID=7604 RepID=UPI001455AFA9|nr:fibroleukin-like [Asterias rubens]
MHSTQWVSFITAVVIASWYGFASVTAFSCSFGREPNPKENGILRWVMPLNHRLRCQCTSIYPGGMNTYTPERGFDPFYTDHPLFTDLKIEIDNYFECENCSLTCAHGGRFIDDPCHCSCAQNWAGKTCTECALTTQDCANDGSLNYATCTCDCPWYWKGNTCTECALQTNDCAHDGSLNDAACTCDCPRNWKGITCTECALTGCENNGTLDAATCTCTCLKQWMGITCTETRHYDCQDYFKANSDSTTGVYTIYTSKYPQGLDVYCDMNWWSGSIVIQRRSSGDLKFTRGWDEYRDGFGDLSSTGGHWLGNEKVRKLTEDQNTKWEIQVKVWDSGTHQWSDIISNFRLSGENYTLHVDGSVDCGNGGVFFSAHGKPFSTHDRDNDGDDRKNCAEESNGGWWFDGCDAGSNGGEINLNAEYISDGISIAPCEPLYYRNTRLKIKRMSGETQTFTP